MYFYCDPRKNTQCKKSNCYVNGGKCNITEHMQYSLNYKQVDDDHPRRPKEQREIRKEMQNGSTDNK